MYLLTDRLTNTSVWYKENTKTQIKQKKGIQINETDAKETKQKQHGGRESIYSDTSANE